MLEFKSFINKKVDGSNFLLSKFQVRKYDLILICLINFFVFLLNFPLLGLQIFCFILIFICLLKLSDISVVKIICLLYVTFAFIFLNEMSQSSEFISFILFYCFFYNDCRCFCIFFWFYNWWAKNYTKHKPQ